MAHTPGDSARYGKQDTHSEEHPPVNPEMQVSAGLTPEPGPVSPVGFAGLAALIGLAAGMVLAPWLERFYHRAVKHDDEEISND